MAVGPYTIVQATQFFEFLKSIADAATHGYAVRVPSVRVQPLAADDVAHAVAKIATGTRLNGTVEIGGPEPFYLSTLIQRVLSARNDPRDVILDPQARYFGAELNERSLVAGDEAELGEIRFDDWLSRITHPVSDQRYQSAIGAAAGERATLKGWLNNRVTVNEKGFIKTGPDLTQQDLAAAQWPLERPPYLLETSRPGVFAVGDVRCGNIKGVASAVGEGSIAVSFVHRVLAE